MSAAGNSGPRILTAVQIKELAALAGRQAEERAALACEQQNARAELIRRHDAERLQLGSTILEAPPLGGNTGLEGDAGAAGGDRAAG